MRVLTAVAVLPLGLTGPGAAQEIFSAGFQGGQLLTWSKVVSPRAIPTGGSRYLATPQISDHSDTPIDVSASIIR